ncbi:hypothetical protein QCQ72_005998 [Bacillus cereus]|nr:hypothetical protein [Bacillus cereus]
MNYLFLPTLKKVHIKSFSLYSSDIEYDFVDGVNLIIGGNGVGKTTFLNIIKYGIIGLYKKELDVKTYMGEKRLGRTGYSLKYFKNRMKYPTSNPEVILTFNINETTFEVTRGLDEILVKRVVVKKNDNEFLLEGKILRQDKYEKLEEKEKVGYLQYQYEEMVRKEANIGSFNDMIFFVNNILFFGEDRKTILWDPEIQSILSSKYFNDPELDNQFQEYQRQKKYHNSLSKHKSEDIRAIKKILNKINAKGTEHRELNTLKVLNEIRSKNERLGNKLDSIQEERNKVETNLKVLRAKKTKSNKLLQEADSRVIEKEANVYKEVWEHLNPKYDLFVENIKLMHSCPLCNQEVQKDLLNRTVEHTSNCILCEQKIKKTEQEPEELKKLKEARDVLLQQIQHYEKEIYNEENNLESLDNDYREIKQKIFDNKVKVRELEHSLVNNNNNNNNNNKDDEIMTYSAMINEIEELEREKNLNLDLSKEYAQKAGLILEEIEGNLIKITKELSGIFSDFANEFLKLKCQLTFDDLIKENVKMYIPIIDGKERLDQEELSESQRFFIDHSFRMSLLNFFYTTPSFFICETPDSSLDISYEENAAVIFLKYLQKPNSLIITSNLNNSEFLEKIIESAPKIDYINLLRLGNPSSIQSDNNKLLDLSKKIEDEINEKKRANS